jgi:hypothetical protein
MYLETIEALPIYTSGLRLFKNLVPISEKLPFSTVTNRYRPNPSNPLDFTLDNSIPRRDYYPDILIPGRYHPEGLFILNSKRNPKSRTNPDHFLLITGLSDSTPSLDFYKFKDAVYTKYVESQDNKGFLFQVVPSNSRLTPIAYSYGTH